MAGDPSTIVPLQPPTAAARANAAPAAEPPATPSPDLRIDTGLSSLHPWDIGPMFSSNIQGYVDTSGGTVQRLQITAPKPPVFSTQSLQISLPNAASSAVSSANRTMTNIDRAVGTGADTVLNGRRRLDSVSPLATAGLDILDLAGRGAISVTPRNAGLTGAVLAANRAITKLIPAQASFTTVVNHPIVYDDKHGTRMLLQPGAKIVGENGVVRIISDGGFLSSGGVTVGAGHTDITVGKLGQKFLMDRFFVQDGTTNVDVRGIQTILGTDGSLISRADSIAVNLPRESVRVSGAQIASPDSHTLSAGFDQLAVRTPGTTLNAGSSSVSSTTNGPLSTLAATTNDVNDVSGKTRFSVDTMTLSLARNRATGEGALKWVGQGMHFDNGTIKINAPDAALGVIRRADGTSVMGVRGRNIDATVGNQAWVTKGNSLLAFRFNAQGQLTDVSAKGDDVAMTDPSLQLQARGSFLHASVDGHGLVTGVDGGTNQFDLLMSGRKLTVSNSAFVIARDSNGVVLKGTAASGRYSDSSGTYTLGQNGGIEAHISKDLVQLSANAQSFTYANGKGNLQLTNGRLNAEFGAAAPKDVMTVTADHVTYTGLGSSNQLTNVSADGAVASLTRNRDGSMALGLSGQNIGATIDGAHLGFTNVKNVDVITNSAGKVTNIDALMPGSSSFVSANGQDRIQVDNVQAHYSDTDQQRVRLSFDHGAVMLGAVGLSGEADGVKLAATANSIRGSIASGSAKWNDISVRLSDVPGQHIQFGAHTDANGVFAGARLIVPQGGAIALSGHDWSGRIGTSDTRLTQHDGVWRVDSHNFDVGGVWKDLAVTAQGNQFDAMLAGNQLILNRISGTNVNVRGNGYNVNINVKELDNLIANVTSIHGLAEGAAVTLTPSKDNSHLTATISAVAAGIPIKIDIKDARAFEGLALIQPNQARVQLQDPTGQGHLRLAVGPLSIEGQGQIGAVATYVPYNGMQQAQDVARMGAGFDVTPNLRISPDGAFTLHTAARDTHLYASGTFLAPLDPTYPWQDPLAPGYQPNLVPTPGWGVIGRLGVQREVTDNHGHARTQALYGYAGAGASSRLNVQIQGDPKLFGAVPVPNNFDVPTTLMGGVGFEDGHWRGSVGGHVTPGIAKSQWVQDPHTKGLDLGINYTNGNFSSDLGGTYELDRRPAVGGRGGPPGGHDFNVMWRVHWAFF